MENNELFKEMIDSIDDNDPISSATAAVNTATRGIQDNILHRYFEVNDIFDIFSKLGFKYFSNFCTRCEENLKPILHRSGLLSIPIFFEDGGFLLMDPSLNFNNFLKRFSKPGLKVINFHPAHVCFNTPNFGYTRKIKDSVSREEWNNLSRENLKKIEYNQYGIRNFLEKIIEHTQKKKY